MKRILALMAAVLVTTAILSGCNAAPQPTETTEAPQITQTPEEEKVMETGLCDQAWDIVMLQAAKSDLDDTLNLDGRRALEQIISERVPQPYTLMWHTSWPSPNDPTFFSTEYEVQPPAGYKDNLLRLYGHDPFTQFTVLTDKAKAHILTDGTYSKAICTGAAIMHAHAALGVPQLDIWRDYTHLSDYGRLLAACALYTQLTGNPIEQLHLESIPATHRHTRFQAQGDLAVTEEMKQIITTSANHALADPWTVPARPAQ